MVGTGSRYEHPRIGGISHFLEHMVFKGTDRRPNTLDIASLVDGVGGEFNAFTSKEYTGYYIKTAAKDLELGVDLLSDMLFHSKYETEEIDRERGVILEEMNMYLDSPRDRVGEIYDHLLYPDQALGQDVIGTRESLHNIGHDELVAYNKQWYAPNNLVVSVAGAFDTATLQAQIEKSFFNRPEQSLDGFQPAVFSQTKPEVISFEKATDQTHLVLGVRAFSSKDSRKYALTLLNIILGGTMSSRLFTQVRERRGLAYAVHTSADLYLDAGSFNCQVGLDHSRVEETIKVILEQFALIRDQPVSAEELTKAKNYMRGKLALSLEDPLGLGMYEAKQQLLHGEVKTVEEYMALIESITAADIQQVAQDIFTPAGLNTAIISPKVDEASLRTVVTL